MIQGMVPPDSVRFASGAGHADFLLGHPDKDDPFGLFEVSQFLLEDPILALALFKVNQLQALPLDERLDGADKLGGPLDSLLGGGEAVAQVTTAEGSDATPGGQFGLVGVEIHPVDALQFQHDMFFLELGQAMRYFHGDFRFGIVLQY